MALPDCKRPDPRLDLGCAPVAVLGIGHDSALDLLASALILLAIIAAVALASYLIDEAWLALGRRRIRRRAQRRGGLLR